jgi:predicted dehydrogenase
VLVNQSDETYRKPTIVVKALGADGKIVADMHGFKIYVKEANRSNGFEKGWNTRYITDFSNGVRFYVRGNEFTRQLDCFVNCIQRKQPENVASFAEAFKTDLIIERIREDATQSSRGF